MSALDWFRRVVCQPQQHNHDDETEVGCIARSLAVTRGESAESLRPLLEAAKREGTLGRE